jgi:diguanylate cyclase (GGDEF)-like protein/PAS domain S-box-containing protein
MPARAKAVTKPNHTDALSGAEDVTGRLVNVLSELGDLNGRLLQEIRERQKAEETLREREETIRALLNAPNETALLIDTEGMILAANETALKRLGAHAAKTLGIKAEDLVGLCVYDLFPPVLSKKRRHRNERVIRTGKPGRFQDERDGAWFDYSIYPVHGANKAVVGLAIFTRDVTEVKKGELALKESQETVKALLNAPTEAALLIDAGGTILALNEMARKRLSSHAGKHVDQDQFIGKSVYNLFPGSLANTRRERNDEVLRSGRPARYEDQRGRHWFDNSTYPVHGPDGSVTGLAIFTRDITTQKQAEATIRHMAYHDTLTGLPNRAAFNLRFETAINDAAASGKGLAVLSLDLDGFKRINDTLGHSAGDSLLQALADRLRDLVREGDTAARLGGDEFSIIFPGISEARLAGEIAGRIVRSVRAPFDIDGNVVSASTSIGISLFPVHGTRPADLLKKADAAMYVAKQAGRNRYHLFSEGDGRIVRSRTSRSASSEAPRTRRVASNA